MEMVPLQNVIFQKLLTLTTSMLVAYTKMLMYKIIQLVLELITDLEILKELYTTVKINNRLVDW